jgi:hypothetical protein
VTNLVIGGHGIGDCIQAIQCASLGQFVSKDQYDIKLAARTEVFDPLKFFFKKKFILERIPERLGEENSILTSNYSYIEELKRAYDNIYYVIPDLLFRNPHAFDYIKYGISPHVIKSHRLSIDEWRPERKIYIGLVTMAPHHRYSAIKPLIIALAKKFPHYQIYFPNVKRWGGEDLDFGNFSRMPENVFIHEDPTFESSIAHLRQSCFGIFADNGPSHFAFNLGMPRIVLDGFMGNPKWLSRWREDPNESIPLETNILDLVNIVESHILFPETSLLPKKMCKDPIGIPELMGFKY